VRLWEKEQENMSDGRCKGCNKCRGLSSNNWNFHGCFHPPYSGKWVAEIQDCPKQK